MVSLKKIKFFLFLFGILMLPTVLILGCEDVKTTEDGLYVDSDLQVGQKWSYRHRDDEEESFLIIGQIEKHNIYNYIFHVYIENVKMYNPDIDDTVDTIPHVPISQNALKRSLVKLLDAEALVDFYEFEKGYKLWREDYQLGSQGVFDVPVADVVDYFEKRMKKRYKAQKRAMEK